MKLDDFWPFLTYSIPSSNFRFFLKVWRHQFLLMRLPDLYQFINQMTNNYYRAWVSTGAVGAAGAWHPPKFWTSPLAPADFEVLNTNWHPQSSFYVISGTLSSKFLTQALDRGTMYVECTWISYWMFIKIFVKNRMLTVPDLLKILEIMNKSAHDISDESRIRNSVEAIVLFI